jgi:hypothetical protein
MEVGVWRDVEVMVVGDVVSVFFAMPMAARL